MFSSRRHTRPIGVDRGTWTDVAASTHARLINGLPFQLPLLSIK